MSVVVILASLTMTSQSTQERPEPVRVLAVPADFGTDDMVRVLQKWLFLELKSYEKRGHISVLNTRNGKITTNRYFGGLVFSFYIY